MRALYLLALFTLLCACARAQGIIIDLTGGGAWTHNLPPLFRFLRIH